MKAHYAYLKERNDPGVLPVLRGSRRGCCGSRWQPQGPNLVTGLGNPSSDSAGAHAPAAARGGQQHLLPFSVGQHSRGTAP